MIRAVLFDRDGTLIADTRGVTCVSPMPYAVEALRRLRERQIKIGVVTNQPALARGTISLRDMEAVHARVVQMVGAVDAWFVCPHAEDAGCACRKPAPGLIFAAQHEFGVLPAECVVVGDIGSDIDAAHNAGARGILVPTSVTRVEEIERAPVVCNDLAGAVERILAWEHPAA